MNLQKLTLVMLTALSSISINIHAQTLGEVAGDFVIPANKDYKYDAPKTKYLGFSYNAFTSADPGISDFVYLTYGKPYKFFKNGGTYFGYATAPINLPDGAVITELKAWMYDNDATEFTRMWLISTPYSGLNSLEGNLETDEAFASTTVQELTLPLSVTVNNASNSYHLHFQSSGSNTEELRLYGARIAYTVTKAD